MFSNFLKAAKSAAYEKANAEKPIVRSDFQDPANWAFQVGIHNNFHDLLSKTGAPAERKTAKLLSVTGIVFTEKSVKYTDASDGQTGALTSTIDTTTYPDKATIKVYNGRGFDVYLRVLKLDGKRIMQYSGEMGELIHDSLKRDDDIRRNGETVFEIGNEYIVTADQCARIADYWYKFLGKKKHLYSLSIPGCAAWYNVGDWYNLQVGGPDTNEYIDAVVECYSVDVEKSAGDIGSTTLLLRDVEDNWAKTTLYAARLATGGSPKRRVNRSNIVTVASSGYDGSYDYICDGTSDEVQIQEAIDYVYFTYGGGTVKLTSGTYGAGYAINVRANVAIEGEGANTIVSTTANINLFIASGAWSRISNCTIIGKDSASYAAVQVNTPNFTISGCAIYNVLEVNGTNCDAYGNTITANAAGSYITGAHLIKQNGVYIVASSTYTGDYSLKCDGVADDVQIQEAIDYIYNTYGGGTVQLTNGTFYIKNTIELKDNIRLNGSGSATVIMHTDIDYYIGIKVLGKTGVEINSLVIDGNSGNLTFGANSGPTGVYALGSILTCSYVTVRNYSVTYALDASIIFCLGFYKVSRITNCTVHDMYSDNTGTGVGTHGAAIGFYDCTDLTGCLVYDMSSGSTRGYSIGYDLVVRANNCLARDFTGNRSTGYESSTKLTNCRAESIVDYGYYFCKSVQQCESVNNTNNYTSSYADSGTTNACADTAAGGYNS